MRQGEVAPKGSWTGNPLGGVKAPEPLLKHYPELGKIADPIYDDMANSNLPLLA